MYTSDASRIVPVVNFKDPSIPIIVTLGPTKADNIHKLSTRYRKFQIASETDKTGTTVVLQFSSNNRYELHDLLHSTSRIRKISISYGDEQHNKNSFIKGYLENCICYMRSRNRCNAYSFTPNLERFTSCKELWFTYIVPTLTKSLQDTEQAYILGIQALAQFQCGRFNELQELENLNWIIQHKSELAALIPEDEFLSLAYQCAEGGEWSGLSEGVPMRPRTRSELLNTFAGAGLRADMLDTTLKIADQLKGEGTSGRRRIQYAAGDQTNTPHYELEDEVGYATDHEHSKIQRNNTKPKGGQVYIAHAANCCATCRRLYLHPDGTPKIFNFDDLPIGAVNIGKDLKDWQPALPPLHLHCLCRPCRYTGYEHWARR